MSGYVVEAFGSTVCARVVYGYFTVEPMMCWVMDSLMSTVKVTTDKSALQVSIVIGFHWQSDHNFPTGTLLWFKLLCWIHSGVHYIWCRHWPSSKHSGIKSGCTTEKFDKLGGSVLQIFNFDFGHWLYSEPLALFKTVSIQNSSHNLPESETRQK
jgi:hypothetical protein